MALSSNNDSITLSNYNLEYNLDYYKNVFPAGTLVDLFEICELNFNTSDSNAYHRFDESYVYTNLANYKINNDYSLNNRLVKKASYAANKFQPTINASSFKIEGESAQFVIKGFNPRPIILETSYSVDEAYHLGYNSDGVDNSVYRANIPGYSNYYSRYYAGRCTYWNQKYSIFIWRNDTGLGIAYGEGDAFTIDSTNNSLRVLTSTNISSSGLYLPTNYQSQMPYIMTCILGGAGGGGSSGVDLYAYTNWYTAGYTKHARYGGAGGGSGATLIMNLSFGTDSNPIGYLIEIGEGGQGGASAGNDATADTYARGKMNAGKNGESSFIYAYYYNDEQKIWKRNIVNGKYTYFAYAGGGGGGSAISSSTAQPSRATGGAAGSHSFITQTYCQSLYLLNGAKGGDGGAHPGNYEDDTVINETDLRSSGLEYPPQSGNDIMFTVNSTIEDLGYITFNTMEGFESSKIKFPSNSLITTGTLISRKYVDGIPYYGAAGGGASSLLALGGLGRACQDPTNGSWGSGGGGGDFGISGGRRGGNGGDGYFILFY